MTFPPFFVAMRHITSFPRTYVSSVHRID